MAGTFPSSDLTRTTNTHSFASVAAFSPFPEFGSPLDSSRSASLPERISAIISVLVSSSDGSSLPFVFASLARTGFIFNDPTAYQSVINVFSESGQTSGVDIVSLKTLPLSDLFATLLAFIALLPHPVIPEKFYMTVLTIANAVGTKAMASQARVLVSFLPPAHRDLFLGFCKIADMFLPVNEVASVCTKLFFRQKRIESETEAVNRERERKEDIIMEVFFADICIRNIAYLTLDSNDVVLEGLHCPNDRALVVSDYVLWSLALFDYPSKESEGEGTIDTEMKGTTSMKFQKNDRIRLINIHHNDWLEGFFSKKRGFLPKSYVKLVLFSSPPEKLKDIEIKSPEQVFIDTGSGTSSEELQTMTVKPETTDVLPFGWTEAIDQKGRKYYINGFSMTSQWTRPTEPALLGRESEQARLQEKQQQVGNGMMMNVGMMGGVNMGLGIGPGLVPPLSITPPSPLLLATNGEGSIATGDIELRMQVEQLRLEQQRLAIQKRQVEKEKEKLVRREEELKVKTQLDVLISGPSPNWMVDFSELELEEKIGEGGFGEVYRARWRGTVVAVKTLKPKPDKESGSNETVSKLTPEELGMFTKEVTILRALRHPNLVLFLGACLNHGLCIISEYLLGGSLYELLYTSHVVLDSERMLALSQDIAKAMAYLHNSTPSIVHRDLKSPNILLDEKHEHAKVGDVGLARMQWNDGKECQEMREVVGTVMWMPPEMMRGEAYTEKADVYSFGMVLYEMCTRTLPFSGMSQEDIKATVSIRNERPPLPEDLDFQWKGLINVCWQNDSSKRPPFIDIINTLGDFDI